MRLSHVALVLGLAASGCNNNIARTCAEKKEAARAQVSNSVREAPIGEFQEAVQKNCGKFIGPDDRVSEANKAPFDACSRSAKVEDDTEQAIREKIESILTVIETHCRNGNKIYLESRKVD